MDNTSFLKELQRMANATGRKTPVGQRPPRIRVSKGDIERLCHHKNSLPFGDEIDVDSQEVSFCGATFYHD